MKENFMDFWRAYAPQKQYHNRFLACRRLWDAMDDDACERILEELNRKRIRDPALASNEKNPYFFLLDWQPPQPRWLSPKQVGYMLSQHIPLAVCFNPLTNCFGTVTKSDAEEHHLQIHHYM